MARGDGILGGPVDAAERLAAQLPAVAAEPGLGLLHRASGFLGTLVGLDGEAVVVRGATGLEKRLRNRPGDFAVDGRPVRLVPVPRNDEFHLAPIRRRFAARRFGARRFGGRFARR